mmetsp:Transcript_105181/g.201968  ORF Transcript_105181/g.201968 Transcript_105181/m.201968 type:complete len:730 (+) Transcript_105181:74-2263(+)
MARARSAGVPFSEVARLKSLSLLQNPALTRSHPQGDFGAPRPVTCNPVEQRSGSKESVSLAADLRSVHQQEFLKAKRDELRRLEFDLEKAVMKERRALKRAEQDMKLIEYHRTRAAETEQKIQRLYEKFPGEVRIEERLARRLPGPLQTSHPNTWGPTENGRWAPGFPAIGQQRPSILGSALGSRAGSSVGSRVGSTGRASRGRSTPNLGTSPRRRTVQPMTQIVMIPAPVNAKKSSTRSSEEGHYSKSASMPDLSKTLDVTPVDAADVDVAGSSASVQLPAAAPSPEVEAEREEEEEDIEEDDVAADAIAEAPARGPSRENDEKVLREILEKPARAKRDASKAMSSIESWKSSRPPKAVVRADVRADSDAVQADEDSHSEHHGGMTRGSSKNSSPSGARASMAVHMADRSNWRLPSRTSTVSFDEPLNVAEVLREAVRVELIDAAGGAMEAFRCMDLSRSGRLTQSEFADGIERLGVPWRELTGFKKPREIYKLFDLDKDGSVSLADLFPEETKLEEHTRMSTPEWWGHWCRKSKDTKALSRPSGPAWNFSGPDEELQVIKAAQASRESASHRRKWISSTMRRMKNQGKSDARCRECCALHLPRGTGPKDRDGVSNFSEMEVKACKRVYIDEVQGPTRNIQKTVFEMREQRRLLQNSRMKLYSVTGLDRAAEMERLKAVTSFTSGIRSQLPRLSYNLDTETKEEQELNDEESADFGFGAARVNQLLVE